MTSHTTHRAVRLTPYPVYGPAETNLERCPNCHNERIGRTPRRKGGPSMFRCRRCGYIASVDQVLDMLRLLGHTAA